MFVSGLGYTRGALIAMYIGRVVMGFGVGGVDSVVPTYSSELSSDHGRGKALAQEFQSNIFGLNMAFAINLGVTRALGKWDQWAWRIPIIAMQVYPVGLLLFIQRLPESPRWYVFHDRHEDARNGLITILGQEDGKKKCEELVEAADKERDENITYTDMVTPGHKQFHPTVITVMGQVNQALTGYGGTCSQSQIFDLIVFAHNVLAVSVYGPQIFELLGYEVEKSEYLTQGNYISYFLLMTFAWLLVDAVGRRTVLLGGSAVLTTSFFLLAIFAGIAMNRKPLHLPVDAMGIPGIVTLFIATGAFGIGWLATIWLIPTEIYPTTARAQGTAVSVIVWGLANFAITLLTPIMFNNLKYYIFLVFAFTNAFAGVWTYFYCPESGGRSFEENQEFFDKAMEEDTWVVNRVDKGRFRYLPYPKPDGEDGETQPLLQRIADQAPG